MNPPTSPFEALLDPGSASDISSSSEFTYNLFTDLAPLLTLFGEPVAKQFLSHTTSWLECLIFACAPIGIITGITSAIRVGGKRWMKSIIGRAGEPEAAAELELMSSTSPDVCELWNGVGIVRVVGSPSILQIIYKPYKPTHDPEPRPSSSSLPKPPHNISVDATVPDHDGSDDYEDPDDGNTHDNDGDDDDDKPFAGTPAKDPRFDTDIELQPVRTTTIPITTPMTKTPNTASGSFPRRGIKRRSRLPLNYLPWKGFYSPPEVYTLETACEAELFTLSLRSGRGSSTSSGSSHHSGVGGAAGSGDGGSGGTSGNGDGNESRQRRRGNNMGEGEQGGSSSISQSTFLHSQSSRTFPSDTRTHTRTRTNTGSIRTFLSGSLHPIHTTNTTTPTIIPAPTIPTAGLSASINSSPPNIFLNACTSSNNTIELILIAFLGICLQSAVLVYIWGITHHPKWKLGFESHEENDVAKKYAFPATFVGTVAIVLGMFICACVVNVSTVERTWVENNPGVGSNLGCEGVDGLERPGDGSISRDGGENAGTHILWLQKGKLVGDQAFGSFAISPHTKKKIIRTSRKGDAIERLSMWALLGSVLAIFGFIIQLLGFRAMHGSASIAQLVATFVMTLLRVLIRRDISRKPIVEPVLEGYELDWMALRICGCGQWGIITKGLDQEKLLKIPITEFFPPPYHSVRLQGNPDHKHHGKSNSTRWSMLSTSQESRLALQVLQTRVKLSELSGWQGEAWQVAEQLSAAIEAVLRCFYEGRAAEFTLKKEYTEIDSFSWIVPIALCSSSQGNPERDTKTAGIRLRLYRTYTGNQWTSWQINRREIEAYVSLWMYQMLEAKVPLVGNALWLLMPYNTVNKITYSWWTQRGSKMNVVCVPAEKIVVSTSAEPQQATNGYDAPLTAEGWLQFGSEVDENGESRPIRVHRSRVLNVNSFNIDASTQTPPTHYLGIVVQQNLYELCCQFLLSLFLNEAAKIVDGLTGKTYVIRGTSDSSYTVGNDSIRCLAGLIEDGLRDYTTREDAYRLVVSPFIQAGHKLLDPSNDRPILQQILSLDRGSSNSLDLLEICRWKATTLCAQDRLKEARKVYTSLIQLSSEVLATHHEFTDSVRTAMKTFIKAFVEARCSDENKRNSVMQVNTLSRANSSGNAGFYPLHKAAVQGNLALLHKYLEAGRNVDTANIAHGQQTPLNYAIKHGHLDIIRLLILYGAHVGVDHVQQAGTIITNNDAQTANVNAVGKLLALNCDPDISIHDAATGGHPFVVQIFAEQGHPLDEKNDEGFSALHLAVSSACNPDILPDSLSIARILLQYNANVDTVTPDYGTTPLHTASSFNLIPLTKLLLSHGANVNARDKQGKTPLHLAAITGSLETVQLLAENHADLSAYTYDLWDELHAAGGKTTALHFAVREGHGEIVSYLAKQGARLDAQNADGRTPLHLAATWNRLDMAAMLVQLGAALNVQDELGVTPLVLYATYGHAGGQENSITKAKEFVELLLEYGADQDITDDAGRAALEHVCLKGNTEIVELLLSHPRRFSASSSSSSSSSTPVILSHRRDAFNRTPLHYAAMQGHLPSVKLLLSHARSCSNSPTELQNLINAPDYLSWTALHFATINCHDEVVSLLKSEGADETLKNVHGRTPGEYEGGYYKTKEGYMRRRRALPDNRLSEDD